MKPRTKAIACTTASFCGGLLGLAIMIVAVSEALNCVLCCRFSETQP